MAFKKILKKKCCTVLSGNTKQAILDELVHLVSHDDDVISSKEILEGILYRETLMSTGIGNGLAVPHVRLPGMGSPRIAIGVAPHGIAEYDSIDNAPIHIVVMIIVEKGEHKKYISLLSQMVTQLKQPDVRTRLLAAVNADDVYHAFHGV